MRMYDVIGYTGPAISYMRKIREYAKTDPSGGFNSARKNVAGAVDIVEATSKGYKLTIENRVEGLSASHHPGDEIPGGVARVSVGEIQERIDMFRKQNRGLGIYIDKVV